MRKFFVIVVLVLMTVMCGCKRGDDSKGDSLTLEDVTEEKKYGFGYKYPNLYELIYEGKPVGVDYIINSSSSECDASFMIFADGVAQKYYTEEDKEEKYVHFIHMEDAGDQSIQKTGKVYFTPTVGSAGKEVRINMVNAFNLNERPDKIPYKFGVGITNSISTSVVSTMPLSKDSLLSVDIKEDNICIDLTEDELSKYQRQLEKQGIWEECVDDKGEKLSCVVAENGIIHLNYMVYGIDGTDCVANIFINNVLIDTDIRRIKIKGTQKCLISIDIPVDEKNIKKYDLQEYNTVYVVLVRTEDERQNWIECHGADALQIKGLK